jgi:Tol biopolymer transport system component
MLYRVDFGGANLIKMSLVITAAMLAICLLALAATTNVAEATSLPENGKITFSHVQASRPGILTFDIYSMNPDGTGLTNLTSESSTSVGEGSPAWSPDGTKIAFSSTLNSKSPLASYDTYVMDADGSNPRRLTYNEYEVAGVGSWSPDGTKIVYTCMKTAREICRVDADGSNIIRLTTSGDNEYPNWSPDGTKIAYRGSSGGIHTMNPDGSNKKLLIARGDQPDWSPDGTKIAYRRSPPGQGHPDIFVANADGSNPVNLSARFSGKSADRTNPWEGEPAWSPDGTKIAFSSNLHDPVDDSSHFEIYVVDASGHNLKQLTHTRGSTTDPSNTDPDWQPLPKPTPPKSRSDTVHPPDTGGLSLLLVASFLLCSAGVLLYAGVRRRM